MSKNKDFGGSFQFRFFNTMIWLILSNFYFVICNILFLIFIATFGNDYNVGSLVIMYISLIPMGPALIALIASMGKIIRDKDIRMTSYFFKAYRDNFKQAMGIWIIGLTVLFVLSVDLYYFFKQPYGGYFIAGIIVIMVIVFFTVINSFVLLSRFFIKTKVLVPTAFFYSIKRLNITIFELVILIIAGALIRYFASYTIFFVFSAAAYLIMFYSKKVIDEIEEQYKASQDK